MLVPKLRFKREDGTDYPEWEKAKLGNHLIQYKEITTANNQYPVLTSSRKGLFLQEEYFNRIVASVDNTGYNIVPYGYFTYRHMSDDTTFYFNINTLVENGIVSTLYPVFTTTDFFCDNFLRVYLNDSPSFSKYCLLQKQGMSRTYMYFSKLSAYIGSFPCLEEQQKIANFLSAVDEVIVQSEAEVQNLEQQKKAAMQKIFSQEVRFQREDGTDYPEWEEQQLSQALNEKKEYDTLLSGYPLLTSSRAGLMYQNEYRDNASISNQSTLFSVVSRGECTYRHMSDDSIFHFNINSLCDKGLVSKEYPVFIAQNEYSLNFIVTHLNSSTRFLEFCRQQKKGGTRTRLYFKTLCNYRMAFPCLEEQQKIADFLSAYDEAISYAKQELDKWKELKKGLLQQMFV